MRIALFFSLLFVCFLLEVFPGCGGRSSNSLLPTPTVQLPTITETINGHKGTTWNSSAEDIQKEYALSNWPFVERTEIILQNKTIVKHSYLEHSLFNGKFDYYIDYNRGTIIFISVKECDIYVLTPPPPVEQDEIQVTYSYKITAIP